MSDERRNDERYSDAIRRALLADDPGQVPARLRSRMAMIPDEAAGRTAMGGWRSRLGSFAVPAAVLAAAAIIAVVFGGIALRGEQVASAVPSAPTLGPSLVQSNPAIVAPTVAPSAIASNPPAPTPAASAPTPAASAATPAPSGPITLQPSQITNLQQRGVFAISNGVAYAAANLTSSVGAILKIDLTKPDSASTLVRLTNGRAVASIDLTNAGIVWIESWYTQPPINCSTTPCSAHQGQPVSWSLNLTTLDGKTTKLDSGVVSRTSVQGEGASPLPPVMAGQGDRVAYAVPRLNVPRAPDASRIIVRSLPDGAVVRTIDAQGYIAQLGVFGQAVIDREAQDTAGAGTIDPGDATLNLAASDGQAPAAIASHVLDATIGDGGTGGSARIAWTTLNSADGTLKWIDLSRSGVHSVRASTGGTGGFAPVTVGDGLAWSVQVQDNAGAWSTVLDVWHPGWSGGREVVTVGSPDAVSGSADELIVTGGNLQQVIGASDGAIAAAALFGTTP